MEVPNIQVENPRCPLFLPTPQKTVLRSDEGINPKCGLMRRHLRETAESLRREKKIIKCDRRQRGVSRVIDAGGQVSPRLSNRRGHKRPVIVLSTWASGIYCPFRRVFAAARGRRARWSIIDGITRAALRTVIVGMRTRRAAAARPRPSPAGAGAPRFVFARRGH
ncbi:hypothetical protein EVAR_44815_1 [Eumeta japonica]|uniref:Uncharacterized protein n=1 Tax=Eumeta variegata TaxID=151549 RepID=A0A4C1XB66_EUMVA|nr:hypothetical protein EVAR_44815_1 [Eumeta japonica]